MRLAATACALTFVLGACSSAPTPAVNKEVTKDAKIDAAPVTGLHALYKMYTASKAWAPDAVIFQLTSVPVNDVKPLPGKMGAWQVIFVSPSLQQSRTFTFSVLDESASLPKGVNAAKPESWAPHGSTTPFPITIAQTDSDAAFETASKKAADYIAKHPDMNVIYQMEQNAKYGNAAWHILWGESAASSSYSVVVDCSTGAYVETLR